MDLRTFLDQKGISYEWRHHDPAYTAQDLAMSEHVPGHKVIKPVLVNADGKMMLCAVPAAYYIDMEELRAQLHANKAELASEPEFAPMFAGCEVGAEPPIGGLFGLPTVMDDSLAAEERVTFQAGSHCDAVTVNLADYMRLTEPTIAHFAKQRA